LPHSARHNLASTVELVWEKSLEKE
jgi:hypothetical protein